MTPTVLRIALGLVAWSASLGAVLSIAKWPGNWEHGICGPWGCGPPLQALVACHLAWLVILLPPSVAAVRSARVPTYALRRIGALLCFAAALFVAALAIWQRMTWWPLANQWQQDYFWQRCGFVLVTTTDLPAVQILLLGIYLTVSGRHGMLSS